MLHEFLHQNRAEILARSRTKLVARAVPMPTDVEINTGLPLFLDQLIAILRVGKSARDSSHGEVDAGATAHGSALLKLGLTVGQVVHDYGSICQSITELADEHEVAISADEFRTFNHCLDDAIAHAVTGFQEQRDRNVEGVEMAHLGFLAHEMRNLLSMAMLTYDAVSKGSVGVHGSTGALLGRSLRRMRVLIDRTLTEVRLGSATQHKEPLVIAELIEEIEIVATLEAADRDVSLAVDAGPPGITVFADHQILASAVANLVQNAFKYTQPHGRIAIRAHATDGRVLIDVSDQCGGLPPGRAEQLFKPFAQYTTDHSGLGLGLAISLKGVRDSGGDIRVKDVPGHGCVFTVDLPRVESAA